MSADNCVSTIGAPYLRQIASQIRQIIDRLSKDEIPPPQTARIIYTDLDALELIGQKASRPNGMTPYVIQQIIGAIRHAQLTFVLDAARYAVQKRPDAGVITHANAIRMTATQSLVDKLTAIIGTSTEAFFLMGCAYNDFLNERIGYELEILCGAGTDCNTQWDISQIEGNGFVISLVGVILNRAFCTSFPPEYRQPAFFKTSDVEEMRNSMQIAHIALLQTYIAPAILSVFRDPKME